MMSYPRHMPYGVPRRYSGPRGLFSSETVLSTQSELRRECLDKAIAVLGEDSVPGDAVALAKQFVDFIEQTTYDEQGEKVNTESMDYRFSPEGPAKEFYDENTLNIVSDTLVDVLDLSGQEAREVVQQLLNRGVLFRERITGKVGNDVSKDQTDG